MQAQLLALRHGIFTAATPADTSVETLSTRRKALAAKHAALLHELAALRASEAFALARADKARRYPTSAPTAPPY